MHGSMLMAFGQFVFSLDTLAFQELKRSNSWRHPSNSRVGARPARQFVGVGDEGFAISGWIAPGQLGDYRSLDELRAMGDSGQAFAMVSGEGEVFGQFVLENLNETGTLHDRYGHPSKVSFDLQLARVDDNAGGAEVNVNEQGQYQYVAPGEE